MNSFPLARLKTLRGCKGQNRRLLSPLRNRSHNTTQTPADGAHGDHHRPPAEGPWGLLLAKHIEPHPLLDIRPDDVSRDRMVNELKTFRPTRCVATAFGPISPQPQRDPKDSDAIIRVDDFSPKSSKSVPRGVPIYFLVDIFPSPAALSCSTIFEVMGDQNIILPFGRKDAAKRRRCAGP